jgi:hypothetical protein
MRSTSRTLSIGLMVAVMALLVSAASAAAATIPIKGGEVDWGIKESFRKYIEGPIAKGKIEVSSGAARAADGTFVFPVASGSYDTKTHVTEVIGTGTVHFTGHETNPGEPQLDLTLSNPRVVVGAETGAVFADVSSKAFTPGDPESFPGVELATLDTKGVAPVFGAEAVSLAAIPAVLTEAGSKAFSGFYQPGAALDPVGVTAAFQPTPPPVEEPKEEPKEEPQKPSDDPQKPAEGSPAPAPAPAPAAPGPAQLTNLTGLQKFGSDGVAKLANLACPSGGATCTTTVPKRLAAKIAGKRYVLGVMAPKKIGAGKSATVRVHVPKAAQEALGAKKYTVKLNVALHANGSTTKQVVKVAIAGKS